MLALCSALLLLEQRHHSKLTLRAMLFSFSGSSVLCVEKDPSFGGDVHERSDPQPLWNRGEAT